MDVRTMIASELTKVAGDIMEAERAAKARAAAKRVAADESVLEEEDPRIRDMVNAMRPKMTKLPMLKNKRLQVYGIGILRPSSTVEELVDALAKVLATV